jgi:sucrose phosphorylase
MADLIVNHVSSSSPQFLDYSEKGDASIYKDLFLTMSSVFPNGATEADLLTIYRPRPGLPFSYVTLKNGKKRLLWTTFTKQQIDINVNHPQGRAYLQSVLQTLHENNIRMVRLDAIGYAVKKGNHLLHDPRDLAFIETLSRKLKLGIKYLSRSTPIFAGRSKLPAKWIASMILRCRPLYCTPYSTVLLVI